MMLVSCDDLNKVIKFGEIGLQLAFVKLYIVIKIPTCVVLRLYDLWGSTTQVNVSTE